MNRLGLSATYRPGRDTIRQALDRGLDFFFCFGFDFQMIASLRDSMRRDRESHVVATGAYNYLWWHQNIRRTVDKRLRQLGTDYIDIFLFLGVLKEREFPQSAREELYRLREAGKIRCIGVSSHDRSFAGELAREGDLDVLMIRYNAAHRGAEEEVFPHLAEHDPGLVSYTATRWRSLLRRPRGWPKDDFVPSPSMCYRFVLSNPAVHVCLMAPSNGAQLEANLRALEEGPLGEEEMLLMRRFGDAVHEKSRRFL